MPTKPPSPSPSQESRATRFSQKFRSLRHLRLGANDQEGQKSAEREFQIIHTPDRPAHLVSPFEAPTEEQCLDEIQGWHSAAERTRIGATEELQPQPLPQQHLAVETDFEAHGDNGEILYPLTYLSPERRSSFITDDGDDVGDIEDLSDWDRSSDKEDPHPTQESIEKFSRLLSYNPSSASQPRPKSPETPEEQFELELESPPAPPAPPLKEGELLNEEQMSRLWSQLRKNKDSGRRSEPRSTATLSCFSSSDDGHSHYGEVHEAQVVDLEQLKRVEKFRRGTCPYCQKAIIDFTAAFCTFCRADLRSCKGQPPPQTISTSAAARPRPERRYDSGRPYTTGVEGKGPGTSPPKPLKDRPILDQSLGGSKKGSQNNLKGASHGSSSKQPRAIQDGARDDKTGYSWQSLVPAHVVEGTYAIEAKRLDDLRRENIETPKRQRESDERSGSNAPPSNPFYTSSYPSSSSSSTYSTSSKHQRQQPQLRPPPRLAHRAVLADLKSSSSSSTQQLRTRPPPPPPERVFYADGSKNTTTRQPRLKLQQSKPHTRDTSESGNTHTPPSPSPLRHEITSKEELNQHKQPTNPSKAQHPPTQYRSPPPPPPPSSSTTSPPPVRPPLRPNPTPKSPPQRTTTNHPRLPTIPSSSGISSTSRPNQSRPLNPDHLRPVPHQPNHPSPLFSDSLLPSRASPPTPTPPMLPSPLMAAVLGPQSPPLTTKTASPKPSATNLLGPTLVQAKPAKHKKTLPPVPQHPPTATQTDYPPSVESESSAQVPVFRYDSWMTPAQRAEYERQISEHGDNADLYLDIFDDYVSEGERARETAAVRRHHRRRTGDKGGGDV